MSRTKSKSETRRIAIQKSAEVSVPESMPEPKTDLVELKALRNTFLPNGFFIKKGDIVEVDRWYAEEAVKQKYPAFTLA